MKFHSIVAKVNVYRSVLRIGLILAFCTHVATSGAGDSYDENNSYSSSINSSFDTYAYEDDGSGYKNETVQDKWEADDPFFYYPQDDEVLKRLNAEVEEMRATVVATEVKIRLDPVALGLGICFSLTGVVTLILCISVTLYCLKLDSLMRQYANKGIMTDARILVSEPPMNTAIEIDETEDKRGLTHVDGSHSSDKNGYAATTLTADDETISYQRMINDSKGGREETGNGEDIPDDHRHTNTSARGDRRKKNKRKNGHESGHRKIRSLLRLAKNVKSDDLVTTEKFQMRRNHASKVHIRCNQKFHSVVEYQNLTCREGSKIRKHLTVIGEDVTVTDAPKRSPREFELKILVLQNYPMSGLPYGEVQRARRCHRCIIFVPCALFGLAFVAVAVYAVFSIAPTFLFAIYVAVLVLQIPLLNCFLGPSLDKLISKTYLEKGMSISSEEAKDTPLEKVPSESSFTV